MAYRLYKFGGHQLLPLGDPQDDVAGADVASDVVEVAGGVTHYAYGLDIVPVRRHTIRHQGIYSSSVETNVNALMALLGQRLQLYRERQSDGVLQYKWARMTSCRWRRDKEQSQHAVVDCTFDAEGNWKAVGTSSASRSGAGSLGVATAGSAWVMDTTLQFTASSTTTHTWRIQNGANGIDFQWSGAVTSGQSVLIEAGIWSVTNNFADAYSGLTVNSAHTAQRWLMLNPSGQTFTITVSAGGGTFLITWYDQWI